MKKWTISLAILLAIAFASTGFAYGPWGRGHDGRCVAGGKEFAGEKALNLTPEQTAKIRDLREGHLKEVKPLQDKLFGKRGEVRLLWLQQTPDKDKIQALQKEIRDIRGEIQDKKTSHRLEVFTNVLTPEQRTQAQAFGARGGFGHGPQFRGQGRGGSGPCAGDGPRAAGPAKDKRMKGNR